MTDDVQKLIERARRLRALWATTGNHAHYTEMFGAITAVCDAVGAFDDKPIRSRRRAGTTQSD